MFLLLAGVISAPAQEFFAPHTTNSTARVVVVQGENLLKQYLADDERVEAAFNRGLMTLAQKSSPPDAWRSFVSSNDVVGIKVFSEPGPLCGTRPAVVAAAVRGLLSAGLPSASIVIWDKHQADLRDAGFTTLAAKLGVRTAGAAESGFDTNNFYLPDSPVIGALVWGDVEFGNTNFGAGKKSFVSKLPGERLTKIISIAPLINENSAGICGHFYSVALGSMDNTRRFEGDGDRLAAALPEIFALPSIGDKVVLSITDALLGQYQGGPAAYVQFSAKPEQLWFSRDPVALDTLALRELARARQAVDAPRLPSNFQIYTNAALLQLGISDPRRIQVERAP